MNETDDEGVIDPGRAQRHAVRASIAQMQHQLQALDLSFRDPPDEPTICCGRGCNGCVWEGYDDALVWWFSDARDALKTSPSAATVTGA